MRTLKQIERETGKIFHRRDWDAAVQKCDDDPASASELDIALIRFFHSDNAAQRVIEARDKALLQHFSSTQPAPSPPAPEAQKAAPRHATLPAPSGLLEDEDIDKWMDRNALAAAPVIVVKVLHDHLAKFTHDMNERNKERNARLDEHETQIKQLQAENQQLKAQREKRIGCEWAGTHEPSKSYAAGLLVTKKGGLWLSLRQTDQTPGMDPLSWKLIVKEGRGHDA